MAARLRTSAPKRKRVHLRRAACLALLTLVGSAGASTPAHASAGQGIGPLPAPKAASAAQPSVQPTFPPVSRVYPAPVRQAYPYPSNRAPQPLPLGQPASLPITMDPLAVCPSTLLTFLNNSTNRPVPLWVAARSCDCYAQERAEGALQDVSSRRCFP